MTKERLQRAANAVEQLKQTIVELLDISSEEVKEMSESSLPDNSIRKISSLVFCGHLSNLILKLTNTSEQIQDLVDVLKELEENNYEIKR